MSHALVPPWVLEDLQSKEIHALADEGNFELMEEFATRFIDGVVHTANPKSYLEIDDMYSNDYRREVLLAALYVLNEVHDDAPCATTLKPADLRRVLDMEPFLSSVTLAMALEWVQSPGTYRKGPKLYHRAAGHVIARCSYECVSSYEIDICRPLPGHETLETILKNMSRRCGAWKRTKDKHLFDHLRAMLKPARLASIGFEDTPSAQITEQINPKEANKILGQLVEYDVSKRVCATNWTKTKNVEMYIAAVGVIRESLDMDVRLYINTEIPYSHDFKHPAFFLICNDFAVTGTQFGYVVNEKLYVMPQDTPNLVLQVILAWADAWRQTAHSPVLDMLQEAVDNPDALVQSNKFFELVRGCDSDAGKDGEEESEMDLT